MASFNQPNASQTRLTPQVQQGLASALQGLQQQTAQLGPQAQQAAGQVQTNLTSLGRDLQTEFRDPTQLDERAQTLLGLQQQMQGQQAAANRESIARQFQGRPGIAQALQAQSAVNQQLASNPLAFQVAAEQRQRALENQQLTNAARQAQTQQAAGLAQASNQAVQQQLGIASSPLQAQGNLINALGSIGQLTGTQRQFKA